MTTASDLVERLAGDAADPAAFDALIACGAPAIAPIVDALSQQRAVPVLTSVLAALRLPDPIASFEPLASNSSGTVVEAALAALAATGDPRAIPILAASKRRFTAAIALGELGRAEAIPVLRGKVATWLGDDLRGLPPADWLSSSARQRDLRYILDVAAALARLGDHGLAAVAIHLAGVQGDDPDAGAEIRGAAVQALCYLTAPGVARALHAAAGDPNEEVAVAAALALLYLGRPDEVPAWIAALDAGGTIAATARLCLEAFAGEHPRGTPGIAVSRSDAEAWWTRTASRFAAGTCYRLGQPAHPGLLLPLLEHDPWRIRAELRVKTGAPIADGLGRWPVTPGERAAIDAWWQLDAARFPPGRLHRWGNSFAPGAVD
jgi:hypothetical protein